jgi:hypothetical protein
MKHKFQFCFNLIIYESTDVGVTGHVVLFFTFAKEKLCKIAFVGLIQKSWW